MTPYPARGFARTLTALGGNPAVGDPTPDAAHLLQPDLASGYKAGYLFIVSTRASSGTAGIAHAKNYIVTAVFVAVGKIGNRDFCYDQGTACSEVIQQEARNAGKCCNGPFL